MNLNWRLSYFPPTASPSAPDLPSARTIPVIVPAMEGAARSRQKGNIENKGHAKACTPNQKGIGARPLGCRSPVVEIRGHVNFSRFCSLKAALLRQSRRLPGGAIRAARCSRFRVLCPDWLFMMFMQILEFEGRLESEQVFVIAMVTQNRVAAFKTVFTFDDEVRTEAIAETQAQAPKLVGKITREQVLLVVAIAGNGESFVSKNLAEPGGSI